DSRLNYLIPRIMYGREDLVKADLANWRELASSEEGWQQIVENHPVDGVTREDFLKGLTKLENTFYTMQTVFENLNLRYANSVKEDGTPTHNKDVLMKMAYVQAKIDDYNKRIELLSGELQSDGISVAPLLEALSNKSSEIVLPTGEVMQVNGDNIEAVITRYYEHIYEMLGKDPSKTVDDVDQAVDKFSDLIQLTARRAIKVEEYKTIRDNPQAYEENEQDTDYVPTDDNLDTEEFEENTVSPKRSFYDQFEN